MIWNVCWLGVLLAAETPAAQQKVALPSAQVASPLPDAVAQHCAACHDSEMKKGGLDLDSISCEDVTQHHGCLGKGRPKTSRAPDAAHGKGSAGGKHLRCGRVSAWRPRWTARRRSIRIPAGPKRSGGSIAPNTRTPFAICWRLDIDAAALLAEGRSQPWLRQCDGRRSLADAAGSLHLGRAEDQPAGGRRAAPRARRRHVPHSAGPHARGACRRTSGRARAAAR